MITQEEIKEAWKQAKEATSMINFYEEKAYELRRVARDMEDDFREQRYPKLRELFRNLCMDYPMDFLGDVVWINPPMDPNENSICINMGDNIIISTISFNAAYDEEYETRETFSFDKEEEAIRLLKKHIAKITC